MLIFKFESNEKDENICSAIKNKIDSLKWGILLA